MTKVRIFLTVAVTVCLGLPIMSGCGGGKKGMNTPVVYSAPGSVSNDKSKDQDKKPESGPVKRKPVYISNRANEDSIEKSDGSVLDGCADSTPSSSLDAHRGENSQSSESAEFFEQVDNADSAAAVDDEIWRQLDLADEYHSLGVIANREGSWEEAQYYFEKGLKILGQLDIETAADQYTEPDSAANNIEGEQELTPEAAKYSRLLNNIVADYRVALMSLGKLEEDVSAAVLVERFGDLSSSLSDDIHVYKDESAPVSYDLPIVMNERVKNSIVYFQTVASDAFEKYLRRSKKYTPMMKEILKQYGLPEDLIYLSLVESGYNPNAYSWARAMGLWQFIASTGRLYGLDRDWWMDERKDPIKSTQAACKFLKELYNKFGNWELAMAAYNGGPGRVSRTIQQQGTRDFWKMRLRRQTMDYVPLIMAAAIIAKNPERYGFNVTEFEPTIIWDEVTIDRCLDLKTVANSLGCSLTDLKELNPELLRNYTPPNLNQYVMKIPKGSSELFWAAYKTMPSPKETSWVKHTIGRGETVSSIAARYGVSQYAITEANNMRSSRIVAGRTLIVPVPLDREFAKLAPESKREYKASNAVYQVRSGDNMWDIARAFGTTVSALREVNAIGRGSRIYVGQQLRIPSSASRLGGQNEVSRGASTPAIASNEAGQSTKSTYKVQRGDSLWDIARRFGTTTSYLRQLNGMGRSSRIYLGQELLVTGSGGQYVTHRVSRGETLSIIARKYRTTTAKIMAQNNIEDPDQILIGSNLRISLR
ncbi:MAG: LysM peptidoglycan-binding domain-containing protein [Candidatus Zixiibacteriota bacterium]